MPKKFRGHKKRFRLQEAFILPVQQSKLIHKTDKLTKHNFSLSDNERIIYVYSRNKRNRITEIISVIYDLFIQGGWITVIYYDSAHGSLHRHETISFEDRRDITTEENVKKKGTRERWLTWAIKDIQKRNRYYKKLFLKRSNININKLS